MRAGKSCTPEVHEEERKLKPVIYERVLTTNAELKAAIKALTRPCCDLTGLEELDAAASPTSARCSTTCAGTSLRRSSTGTSKWDVEGHELRKMFSFARSFNGDLSKWDVSKGTDFSGMFDYSGCKADKCGCADCK